MRARALVVAGLATAALGCGRAHLSSSFGVASRETLALQRGSRAQPPPTNMALDTQEASVISKSYVRSLAGPEQAVTPEPILVVTSRPGQQGQPQQLAPSVPKQ